MPKLAGPFVCLPSPPSILPRSYLIVLDTPSIVYDRGPIGSRVEGLWGLGGFALDPPSTLNSLE